MVGLMTLLAFGVLSRLASRIPAKSVALFSTARWTIMLCASHLLLVLSCYSQVIIPLISTVALGAVGTIAVAIAIIFEGQFNFHVYSQAPSDMSGRFDTPPPSQKPRTDSPPF